MSRAHVIAQRSEIPWVGVLCAGLLTLVTGAARGQTDRCANCHLANSTNGLSGHLQDYELSAHARERVACSDCHRGDSSTFDRQRAHLGVLPASDPESAVHPANIPVTCGTCHPRLFVAYSESPHFGALQAGELVPTCVDCHGEAGSQRTLGVRGTCEKCHESASRVDSAMLDRAADLQRRYLELAKTRRRVERKIQRVDDAALVHDLEVGFLQAESAWQRALEGGHALDLNALGKGVDSAELIYGQLLDVSSERKR